MFNIRIFRTARRIDRASFLYYLDPSVPSYNNTHEVSVKHVEELVSRLNACRENNIPIELVSRLAKAIADIDASRGIRFISRLRNERIAAQVCLVAILLFYERGAPGLGRIYAEAFETAALDCDEAMPCFGHIQLAGLTQRSDYLEGALNHFRRVSLERRCLSLACVIILKNLFANHPVLLMQAKCEYKQAVTELREASNAEKQRFISAMAKAAMLFSSNADEAQNIIAELDKIAPYADPGNQEKNTLPD